MANPVVYGPAYSTYTRTARLALEEKGAPYKLEEVDIMQGAAQTPAHLARHPFGKVPAFSHDGLDLYETVAISRYIDEAFAGPKLQPADAKARARMQQIIAINDSYAYPSIIQKVLIQRIQPMLGSTADEKVIAEAMPMVEKSIAALDGLAEGGGYLVGGALSLADLHLAPVIDYFSNTPEGKKVLPGAKRLSAWWEQFSKRPSVQKTKPQLG